MKLVILLAAAATLISCSKTNKNEAPIKLLRKEATTYSDILQTTEYVYDSQDRIIAVKHAEDNVPLNTTVTVTYNGNEVILTSNPNYDPPARISKEVRLTLDGNGKLLKKIGYTFQESSAGGTSKKYLYDTLECTYDAAGFLQFTKRSYRDTSWTAPGNIFNGRAVHRDTFTTVAGNLTRRNQGRVFNSIIVNAGDTTRNGLTANYNSTYHFTNNYPNKMLFKNAVVLDETLDFHLLMDYYEWTGYFETPLAEHYQNMADKIVTHSINRDYNGNITFDYTSAYETTKIYNTDGLLSEVNITTPGTGYSKLKYFYGR